jgi:hypothetical protein
MIFRILAVTILAASFLVAAIALRPNPAAQCWVLVLGFLGCNVGILWRICRR